MKYLLFLSLVLFPALANAQSLVNPVLVSPTTNGPIHPGNSFQLAIQSPSCTTAASAGATCNTIVTFPTAAIDVGCFVICTCQAPSGEPAIVGATPQSTTTASVTIAALTAVAAVCANLECLVVH